MVNGATGQDGLYMVAHLLEKCWKVHAVVRKNSINLPLLDHLQTRVGPSRLVLHFGCVTDPFFVFGVINESRPEWIFNFAA